MSNNHTKESVRKQVEVLMEFLHKDVYQKCHTNKSITRSSAYHLIAKIHGFENWNTLSAHIKNDELLREEFKKIRQ